MDGRPSRRDWALLLGLVAAAGVVRVAWIVATESQFVPYSDSVKYVWMARSLLGTSLVQVPAYFHPLFPAWLAAWFSVFGDSLQSARTAASVPGVLLLVPIFLTTYRCFGARAAWWAVGVGAVLPGMISVSLEVFDVHLAALLLALAAWTGGWARPGMRGTAQGILIGLAYLTRPEAPVFGAGLALGVWLAPDRTGEGERPVRTRELAGLAAGFVLVAAPYLIHLRLEHDRWMVSPKQTALATGLGSTSAEPGASAWPGAVRVAAASVKLYALRHVPDALPPLLLLAVAAAVAFDPARTRERARREVRLLCLVGAFVLTFPITLVPNFRYLMTVFPLLLPWIGRGAERVWHEWLGGDAGPSRWRRPAARAAAALVAVAVLTPPFVRLARAEGSFDMTWPAEYAIAARWFREHTPRGDAFGYARSTLVFLAERPLHAIPAQDLARPLSPAELRERFRHQGARWLVLSERYPPPEPALRPLLRGPGGEGWPAPALTLDWGSGRGVVVFDLAP